MLLIIVQLSEDTTRRGHGGIHHLAKMPRQLPRGWGGELEKLIRPILEGGRLVQHIKTLIPAGQGPIPTRTLDLGGRQSTHGVKQLNRDGEMERSWKFLEEM